MLVQLFQSQGDLFFNISTLALRLALGLVIFPHGAQKLLGWFGGYGFKGTMGYFTQTVHAPSLFGFLAIVAEFFGSLAILAGFLTRLDALAIGAVMLTATLTVHRPHGFFMNWFGNQQGEGFEYFILAIAISLALLITGGGAWSLDTLLTHAF